MYSKLHLIYVLLFVGILELPTVVMQKKGDFDSYEFRQSGMDVRCKLQPNAWDCFRNRTASHRFYYDITMESCKTYPYGGCDYNFNGFTSLRDCSSACQSEGAKPLSGDEMNALSAAIVCSLQHDFGTCFNYYPMFYFDTSTRVCKGFSFSGCGGNRNRFSSMHECMDICGTAIPEYKLVRRKKI